MKQILLAIVLIIGTACATSDKPGNSYYGRKVQQAYVDGCISEALREYGAIGRYDLIELREKACLQQLKDYSQ